MPIQKRELWRALFQSFHHCIQIEPTKKWLASSKRPLDRLTGQLFSNKMEEWLRQPIRLPRLLVVPAYGAFALVESDVRRRRA